MIFPAVAWEYVDVKLLVLCALITATLVYVFYKRYHQVRERGYLGRCVLSSYSQGGRRKGLHHSSRVMGEGGLDDVGSMTLVIVGSSGAMRCLKSRNDRIVDFIGYMFNPNR